MSGGSGRLWLTNDGHGRIELQSNLGDAQIVWSPTAADRLRRLLQHRLQGGPAAGGVERRGGEGHAADAGARSPTCWRRSASTSRCPRRHRRTSAGPRLHRRALAEARRWAARRGGGLLGRRARRAAASRDLRPGLVLARARADHERHLLRRGRRVLRRRRPAREREGRRSRAAPPGKAGDATASETPVTGSTAVQAAVDFPVVAPDTLVGLPRQDVRLVGDGESQAALVIYGQGLGASSWPSGRPTPSRRAAALAGSPADRLLDGVTGARARDAARHHRSPGSTVASLRPRGIDAAGGRRGGSTRASMSDEPRRRARAGQELR